MKNKHLLKRFISLWFITLTVIFIASCTFSINPQEQARVTTTAPTATASITQMAMNSPKTTMTQTPTAPNTPLSLTATSLPIKTPVPTLTPIPTLSIEQTVTLEARERLVQELMLTNGNCQLPCWWGIELGKNLESTGEIFTTLGIGVWRTTISDFGDDGNRGYIKSGYFDPASLSYNVGISMDFYTVDGKVQFIDILAERSLRQYGEEELVRDWEKYSISSMLQQYGKPPYVYLIPQNVADPGAPNFVLILYYPDMGFKFSYQPHDTFSSKTRAELCLTLKNMRQINLSLYNPEFVDVWANYLLPPALNPEADNYIAKWTWEAQTGMDLDTFYETYKDSSSPECIQATR